MHAYLILSLVDFSMESTSVTSGAMGVLGAPAARDRPCILASLVTFLRSARSSLFSLLSAELLSWAFARSLFNASFSLVRTSKSRFKVARLLTSKCRLVIMRLRSRGGRSSSAGSGGGCEVGEGIEVVVFGRLIGDGEGESKGGEDELGDTGERTNGPP